MSKRIAKVAYWLAVFAPFVAGAVFLGPGAALAFMARFKTQMNLISAGQYVYRGKL